MANRPLRFFWVAFYNDGTLLPQFDPHTGDENKYGEVTHEKLTQFGLFPFPPPFAEKVQKAGTIVVALPLPTYKIHLEPDDVLIFHRRNFIKTEIQLATQKTVELDRDIIYVLGYTRFYRRGNKMFEKRHNLMYIHENGSVEFTANQKFGKPRWSK